MAQRVELPARFAQLKTEIANAYPDFDSCARKSWVEILERLETFAQTVKDQGSGYIPEVGFKDLDTLGEDQIARIRRVGTVVIRDIVDDTDAIAWRESLQEFVRENPTVEGSPADDKQFFQLYWTKAQVRARSHPNVLAATVWLNNLYHVKGETGKLPEGVDLSAPLAYADRFRMRHPGNAWNAHPPHVDGGTIERWEEPNFRKCFADIFNGNWTKHDPFELEGRLDARSSLYGRPNQSSVFRTFQGWLALSEIAPRQGTLQVFPDVGLSNAYIILRPFFRPLVSPGSVDIFKAENWELDLSSSHFPGIFPRDGGYGGPQPTNELHPHLRLDTTMTSIPKVSPGDAVFWHCDVVHSVEVEHTGKEDSAVMYIPAVPLTKLNLEYIEKQKQSFLERARPPDFPRGEGESKWSGVATEEDIWSTAGRAAMGFA